jgi:hypothetical protein
MKRGRFIRIGSMAAASPFIAHATPFAVTGNNVDDALLNRLIIANDHEVKKILAKAAQGTLIFSRNLAHEIATLVASFCNKQSEYHHQSVLLDQLALHINFMSNAQSEDGTVNAGNIESPPDTAFLIEILCPALLVLSKEDLPDTKPLIATLSRFILKAGNGLLTGGVHTPNHRWVVCSALAQINSLFPDSRYVSRIDAWLAEGVYCDSDGHYSERSAIYSAVENSAFINIARLTKNDHLLQYVRRNLSLYLYYIEPNGDVVTNDSRRQDQFLQFTKKATLLYLQYRYMAIHDNHAEFASMTKLIESLNAFEVDILGRSLIYFMEVELLSRKLPVPAKPPFSFEKLFSTSGLLRIRHGKTSATFFGGNDWPIIIASGRSNSPDFFSFRKGDAILKYMRLSTTFFNTGYFYSQGLKKEGHQYILHQKQEAPYYQPLNSESINAEGDYKLSPSTDNRFWSKMDFQKRPVSNVKVLSTTITLTHHAGTVELDFAIEGTAGVSITIEMCFETGGKLMGVHTSDSGNHFLENGEGSYLFKEDKITFGPGNAGSRTINNLEGERYSTHFGTLKTDGAHVFIKGKTPFKHKLIFS